jgi:hypothetical protein
MRLLAGVLYGLTGGGLCKSDRRNMRRTVRFVIASLEVVANRPLRGPFVQQLRSQAIAMVKEDLP